MPRSKGRSGRPWRRLSAQVIAESGGTCAVCWTTGPRPDCPKCSGSGWMRDGRHCTRCKLTVDHRDGNPDNNDRANLRAAHNTPCNSHRLEMPGTSVQPRRSQAW